MTWFVLAIISVLGSALANVTRRVLMKDDKTDAVSSSIFFQFLGTFIIAIITFIHGFVMPPISEYWLNFILDGIFWGMATRCLFIGYKYLEASEATIMSALEAVVTLIAARLVLNEIISLQMLIGVVCILFAIYFISQTKNKFTFNKGILYILGFCLFAGLGVINDTYVLQRVNVDALSYLTIGFFLPGIFLSLLDVKALVRVKNIFHKEALIKNFVTTFFYALAAILFTFALAVGGQASQVQPISESSVIVTVVLATIFLRERDNLIKKIICSILVTIGVILLR